MLAATMSSAMATRMMYGLSTSAGVSGLPPKVMTRCGSDRNTWAPNLDSSLVQPIAPSYTLFQNIMLPSALTPSATKIGSRSTGR
jgi:hypothetical protein